MTKWMVLLVAVTALLLSMVIFFPTRLLNILTDSGHYALTDGVRYHPSITQQLDIYRPVIPRLTDRPSAATPASPVIIFFYGGTWNRGARANYRFVASALTARGFVVVIPDYRLYPEVRYPEFLKDCAQAVAWTARNIDRYGGDPQRIFLLGHSAGAYNTAMLALDPRWLQSAGVAPGALKAWAGLAGPYHFLPSDNPDVQPVFMYPDYPAGAQPIEYVGPLTGGVRTAGLPAFIGAAAADTLVDPQQNSVELAQQMQLRGTPVVLKLYSGLNHMTLIGAFAWPLRFLAPVLEDVTNYFQNIR